MRKNKISEAKRLEILDKVVDWRGCPKYIRCDNGPEFISHKLKKWAKDKGIELKFIQPEKPSQNGLIERLNKTLRAECLGLSWFANLVQLNEALQEWWTIYNIIRPHRNIGRIAPDKYEILNKKFYFTMVAA